MVLITFSRAVKQISTSTDSYDLLKNKVIDNSTFCWCSDISEDEIPHTIKDITSKREDIYELSTYVLKSLASEVKSSLTTLINRYVQEEIFPDILKIGKVIPLYKKCDVNDLNNYRRISILPTFLRVFEKLIINRLINYFENLYYLTMVTKTHQLFQNLFSRL